MSKVRIGLIGLGFMGTTHWGIYQNLPQAEVVAVADIDAAKQRGDISSVSGNLGDGAGSCLDFSNIAVYGDALEMIASAPLDMVDICVPTPDHAKYIIAALEAGLHVFSEKPLCRNLEELEQIRQAVKNARGFFNVGMCIRSWPEYDFARELYLSGKLGQVRTALFRRLSPTVNGNGWENWYMDGKRSGGALLDLHLHDTDAVCHFFGRPRAVSSFGAKNVTGNGTVDQVFSCYDYGDGRLITAEGGWAAAVNTPFEMSFQIVGEKGTAKLDASGFHIFWNDGTVESPVCGDPALPTGWHVELEYFTRCVATQQCPNRYQTAESIFDSFAVVMAEQESVDSGKKVEVRYV